MPKRGLKWDQEFMTLLDRCCLLDRETGQLTFKDLYASLVVNVMWKGKGLPIPYSHLVWFKMHKRWPKVGSQLDHVNDNPLDNRPSNLDETTHTDNQKKRRGRVVYRSYGSGKYGYGFEIYSDKRDGRHYVRRNLSRGHGSGELKTINKGLGGFATLAEAEDQILIWIEQIKKNGLNWMPESIGIRRSLKTRKLHQMLPKITSWRKEGKTLAEIKKLTGFSEGTLSKHLANIDVDKRTAKTVGYKLNIEDVRLIREAYAEGYSLADLGREFEVSAEMIGDIVYRRAWKHVK